MNIQELENIGVELTDYQKVLLKIIELESRIKTLEEKPPCKVVINGPDSGW